jgi:riboflavin kinase/FMN adenylyltransferase
MEEITAKVERGAQRGRELGFPTLNFLVPKVSSSDGIYLSEVSMDNVWWPGLTFIGKPVTFNDPTWRVETYLLNFDGDLYGQILTVKLLEKIRDNQKFDSIDELKKAMHNDLRIAHEHFEERA